MPSRRLLLLTVTTALLVTALFLTWQNRHPPIPPAPLIPITFCYVPEYDSHGALSDHPSFWATNHTDKILTVSAIAIESRAGSNWVPLKQFVLPMKAIYFETGRGRQIELGPHESAFGQFDYGQRMVLPTGSPWRVKVSVAEKVVGLGSDLEASRHLAEFRLRTGNTNIPWHVIGTPHASYRHQWAVFSQEVALPRAAMEPESEVLPKGQAAGSLTPAAPEAIAAARVAMRQRLSQLPVEPKPGQLP